MLFKFTFRINTYCLCEIKEDKIISGVLGRDPKFLCQHVISNSSSRVYTQNRDLTLHIVY